MLMIGGALPTEGLSREPKPARFPCLAALLLLCSLYLCLDPYSFPFITLSVAPSSHVFDLGSSVICVTLLTLALSRTLAYFGMP